MMPEWKTIEGWIPAEGRLVSDPIDPCLMHHKGSLLSGDSELAVGDAVRM